METLKIKRWEVGNNLPPLLCKEKEKREEKSKMIRSKKYKGKEEVRRRGEIGVLKLNGREGKSKIELEKGVAKEVEGEEVWLLTDKYIVSSPKAELGLVTVLGGMLIKVKKGSVIIEKEEGKYVEVTNKGIEKERKAEEIRKLEWKDCDNLREVLDLIVTEKKVKVLEKVKGKLIDNVEYNVKVENESSTQGAKTRRMFYDGFGYEWSEGKLEELLDEL